MPLISINLSTNHSLSLAYSTEAVEYTDCISAEGLDPTQCPEHDIKQSDGKDLVMLELWRI